MRPTRTPSRRAISGPNAAARMRSPMVVRWKKRSSPTMVTSTAPTTKMSNGDTNSWVSPAFRSTRENGAGKDFTWPPKSIGASASRKMSSPSVRMTTLSAGRELDRPHQQALDACAEHEPAAEGDHEREPVRDAVLDGEQRDVRGEHPHRALRVVDHARGPPDHHQRERDGRVHEAVGDAVDGEDEERSHLRSRGTRGAARRRRRGARRGRAPPPCPARCTTASSATDSALRAFCSMSSTARWRSRDRVRSRAMICASTAACSPSEGSSSRSTRGRDASARPMESIWRSPPERLAACTWRRASSGGNSSYASSMASALVGAVAPPQPAEAEVLVDGDLADDPVALGDVGDAQAGDVLR